MRQISGSARSKKVRVDLGAESDFSDLPKLVKVGTANYFLVKGNEGYRMLSTLCPHQGGEVEDVGEDVFVCDTHGYEYEKDDGTLRQQPEPEDEGIPGDPAGGTVGCSGARRIGRGGDGVLQSSREVQAS